MDQNEFLGKLFAGKQKLGPIKMTLKIRKVKNLGPKPKEKVG